MGVSWHFIVVLICVFLMISDVEHLLMGKSCPYFCVNSTVWTQFIHLVYYWSAFRQSPAWATKNVPVHVFYEYTWAFPPRSRITGLWAEKAQWFSGLYSPAYLCTYLLGASCSLDAWRGPRLSFTVGLLVNEESYLMGVLITCPWWLIKLSMFSYAQLFPMLLCLLSIWISSLWNVCSRLLSIFLLGCLSFSFWFVGVF